MWLMKTRLEQLASSLVKFPRIPSIWSSAPIKSPAFNLHKVWTRQSTAQWALWLCCGSGGTAAQLWFLPLLRTDVGSSACCCCCCLIWPSSLHFPKTISHLAKVGGIISDFPSIFKHLEMIIRSRVALLWVTFVLVRAPFQSYVTSNSSSSSGGGGGGGNSETFLETSACTPQSFW